MPDNGPGGTVENGGNETNTTVEAQGGGMDQVNDTSVDDEAPTRQNDA